MLRATFPLRILAGVESPFLCAIQPQVLRDVLKQGRTRENIELVMKEVARQHLSSHLPIFQETNELVSACAAFDSKGFSMHLVNFVKERKTNLPLFDIFFSNANESQKRQALKSAMQNNDVDSVRKILSYMTNEKKELDGMFEELKNTTKLSNEMIQELLPHCSERVQSRYLNQMIIEKNVPAVKIIIKFFQPTTDHRKLATIHFSAAFSSILGRLPKAQKDGALGGLIPGYFNSSFQPLSGAKEAGKHLVMTACETVKSAMRRMGYLPALSDVVPFDENTNLDYFSNLALSEQGRDFSFEPQRFSLTSGSLALTAGGISVAEYVNQKFQLKNEFFALPKFDAPNIEQKQDGFGGKGAATVAVAVLGIGAMLVQEKAGETSENETKPVVTLVQETAASTEEKVVSSVVQEQAEVLASQVLPEGKALKTYYGQILAQMKADREAGLWRV